MICWSSRKINESENKIYTSINKLRCNLHFLLGLSDAADKELNEYDKIVQNNGIINSKVRIQKHRESGATEQEHLGRSHLKKHGSEQAGVMLHFADI